MQIPTLINRGRTGFNMTPMIDVVFLLIIFFLVASHLSDQEIQIELELPSATSSQLIQEDSGNRITFHIPNQDRILHAGKPVRSLEALGDLIRQARDSNGNDVEVRIRTDRTVPYSAVTAVLSKCTEAGIWNVSFAVKRKQGGP